ncbi:MAG: MFS transporter [Anaerovoracaceae bacterium]
MMGKTHITRWIYLIIGTVLLLLLGLIYAWSIFKAPFTEVFPTWSVSQLSMTFTISMIFFCLGGFASGQIIKKVKPAFVMCISAAFLFSGFLGVSAIGKFENDVALILLYIFYGIMCGSGVGLGYNCVISTVNSWFSDKAGFSSGILLMGFGFGGLLFGGLVSILIDNVGLFAAFRILSVAAVIILVAGSFFMKASEEIVQESDREYDGRNNLKTGEMLRDSRFWLFILWSVLLNSAGLLVINSAANIAFVYGAPTLFGLFVSVFNGAGRVILGGAFDKYRRKITLLLDTVFVFTAGALLISGDFTNHVWLILIGLFVTGIGYGGVPAITSAFVHS